MTMIGIVNYGVYIPRNRLKRDDIAKASGSSSLGGEKSVSNYDEDTITMGVAAALECVRGIDRGIIDGVFFATTTSPYQEKLASSLISCALGLKPNTLTADYTNSLRSATIAMQMAMDSIKSGSARNILIITSDCRLGAPGSDFEQSFGDGAVALLMGNSQVAASVEGSYSVYNEIMDIWRKSEDVYVRSSEKRFSLSRGYSDTVKKAVLGLKKKYDLALDEFSRVVLYGPDQRSHLSICRTLGLESKMQLQDLLFTSVGNIGSAHVLLMLAASLEKAEIGEKILLVSYGDGSDGYFIRVTEEIQEIKKERCIMDFLESKKILSNYNTYLRYRQIIETPEERVQRQAKASSAPTMWRDHDVVLSLKGSKCSKCSKITYPAQRVCYYCQAKDDFEMIKLNIYNGTVFTFTVDNLAGNYGEPQIMTVVESEEGARIYCEMTECDPTEIRVGMPVEMTFRKIHEGGGFNNYFWKSMPVRGGK